MAIGTARVIGSRPRRVSLWRSREAFFTDLAVLVLSVAGMFSLNLVGSVPGNEVLLLPGLPVLLLYKGGRAFKPQYRLFWILVGAWLLGTIIADFYFASPMSNRLKGAARVVFFAMNFATLAILVNGKTRRMVIFCAGLALVMASIGLGSGGEMSVMWKFGLSGAVSIAALLVSSYYYEQRKYAVCTLISMGLAGLNLYYGFRSQLLVHLVAAVLILPLFDNSSLKMGSPQSRFRIVLLLILAGGTAYGANVLIKYAAEAGLFDESLSAKFETQAQGDYGVLVGGRPETLVAIQAIRDSPILGHGSYPVDPKYLQLKQDIQYEHGYTDSDDPEEIEDPVIPTHSHLTMAWVESGILGGICWIYIFALVARAAFKLGALRPPMAPLYSFLLVWFLWDILYSPFGSVNRIWAAFFVLLSYCVLQPSLNARLVRRLPARYQPIRPQFRPPRRAVS